MSNDDLRNAIAYVERIHIDYPHQKPMLDIVLDAAKLVLAERVEAAKVEARIAALARARNDALEGAAKELDSAATSFEQMSVMPGVKFDRSDMRTATALRNIAAVIRMKKSPESLQTQGQ